MPLASWPARANRKVQTTPIRPGSRRGPAAGPPVPRLGSMTHRAHRWALSPLAIVTSWLRSKRWLLSPAVPPPPTDLSPDRHAAAIMTTFRPPTIMAATTSALPARIDHSAQLRNGRSRYLRRRILGWEDGLLQNAA